MKILVLSLNAWNVCNSTGNTLSNLYSELGETDVVANIYCRDENIDNTICEHYYKITEKDIISNIITPKKCGKEFYYNAENTHTVINKNTSQINYNLLRKYRFTSLLLLRELIWHIPVWKNRKLKHFLLSFNPDIIYMHGHYNCYMHRLLHYCNSITGAKVVMYWADDMYGRKSKAPLSFFYESLLRRRFRESILLSSLLLGGSLQLCDEYSRIFGKQFVPFFKECKRIQYDENKIIGNPLTIVYAGNLLFGREGIMVELVKAIARVNNQSLSHQFQLKVFSNTTPSVKSLAYLDDGQNSIFMGCRPYSEVCVEMDKSDLVLFIEAFDKKSIKSTRLSFSTKIIDCMQSTAGILAIGPAKIASIDYINKNNLGYVITDVTKIDNKLAYLADNSEMIKSMNKKKVEFAKRYHTNTSAKAITEIKNLI